MTGQGRQAGGGRHDHADADADVDADADAAAAARASYRASDMTGQQVGGGLHDHADADPDVDSDVDAAAAARASYRASDMTGQGPRVGGGRHDHADADADADAAAAARARYRASDMTGQGRQAGGGLHDHADADADVDADADAAAARASYTVDVEADRAALAADQAHIELVTAAVQCILERESIEPAGASVNVLLTGDDRLRALNREFAGDDYTTDVLAFPTDAGEAFPTVAGEAFPADDGESLAVDDGEPVVSDAVESLAARQDDASDPSADKPTRAANRALGDIAISMPQVRRQAREHGVSVERELALLAIHGTLHLLGYDHSTPSEERDMFGRTDAALAELFGDGIG